MGDSLKDQLLKLGLGTQKPAGRGADERAKAKRGGARRRDASPRDTIAKAHSSIGTREAPGANVPDAGRAAASSDATSAHARPSLRAQRQADRERSARQIRVLERIEANKLDDAQAEVRHYYSTGRKIKWLYVTEAQQAALQRGEIVIAIAQGRGRLVAASLVPSLREIDPDLRVVDPGRAGEGDGDPAHDVPDDLRW